MKSLLLILTFLVGCNAKLDPHTPEYTACARQCAPRAVGQLKNAFGKPMCGCDVVYQGGK